jgi:hypothetical protein
MSLKLNKWESFCRIIRFNFHKIFALILIIFVIPVVCLYYYLHINPLIFISILGILIALYASLYNVLESPHLKILFHGENKETPYLDVFNECYITQRGLIPIKKKIYLRSYIRNLGVVEAHNCETKIKVWEEGKRSPVDYQTLHWAKNEPITMGKEFKDYYISINVGFEERLDVLIFDFDFDKDKMTIETYSLKPFALEFGKKYKVDLELTSANSFSDSLTFEVDLTKLKEKLDNNKKIEELIKNVKVSLETNTEKDKRKQYLESQSEYDILCSELVTLLQRCIKIDKNRIRKLKN